MIFARGSIRPTVPNVIGVCVVTLIMLVMGVDDAYGDGQLPAVRFEQSAMEVVGASANDVKLIVDGQKPDGFHIGYWVWSEKLRKRVPGWGGQLRNEPWSVAGDEIRKLPEGRNKLIVYYAADGLVTQYLSKWLLVKQVQQQESEVVQTQVELSVAFDSRGYEFVRGSGKDVLPLVKGSMPSGAKFGYWAWSNETSQRVNGWGREITGEMPRVLADDLQQLKAGRYRINAYLVVPKKKGYYFATWLNVLEGEPVVIDDEPSDDTGVGDDGDEQVDVLPTVRFGNVNQVKFVEGAGVDVGFEINGALPEGFGIGYWMWSEKLGKRVPNWGGAIEQQPWVVRGDELSKLPSGRNKIVYYAYANGMERVYGQQWLHVDVKPVVEVPKVDVLPTVSLSDDVSLRFVRGQEVNIPLVFDGGLPEDFQVGYWAWSQELGKTVPGWRVSLKQGPWQISAEDLQKLPSGRNKLIIFYTAKGFQTIYLQQWIQIVEQDSGSTAGGSQGSTGGSSSGGSATGSAGDSGTTSGGSDGTSSGGGTSGSGTTSGGTVGDGGTTGGAAGGNDDVDDEEIPEWDDKRLPVRHKFLGMNLGNVSFWTDSWVWANVFKQASYRRNENGWDVYEVWNSANGHIPQGEYQIEFEGEGDVEVKIKSGILIYVKGEVKNVRVWAPGCGPGEKYAGSTFHPLFLERLRPFSVIRFMDWQLTNNSEVVTWADRTLPSDPNQSAKAIALEYMIELANTLNADPWFCMPHKADDEFVRAFAQMCREKLKPGLKVYVEYSNEVWNGGFQQYQWVANQAKVNASLGRIDANKRWLAQWAYEAGRDFDIWSEVYAGRQDKLVRVLAAQETNPWIAQKVLESLDGRLDALATTAYFGSKLGSASSLQEVMALAVMDIFNRKNRREKHKQLAQMWSQKVGREISYIAYEAGQHLYSKDSSMTGTLTSAQKTASMYHAIIENMKTFEGSGGSLYVAYQYVRRPSKWGSWGHLEYQDQPIKSALKYRAMIDYLTSKARLELSMFD